MKNKKFISVFLLLFVSIILYPLSTQATGWDVTGYEKFGSYDFEYTNNSKGILTNPNNPNSRLFDTKGKIQEMFFLPGAKNFRDYVEISYDNGNTFTMIGEPDTSSDIKGEYVYKKNITNGTVFKVKNVGFYAGYTMDALVKIRTTGSVIINTNSTESLFNFEIGMWDYPPVGEYLDMLELEIINSKDGLPIPVQNDKFFLLTYDDSYFKGYNGDPFYREPLTLTSEGLKYYQKNKASIYEKDKSLYNTSTKQYIISNFVDKERQGYGRIERLLFLPIGNKIVFHGGYNSGMTMRKINLFYNTRNSNIPKSYDEIEITSQTSNDNKYNAEYILKQKFPKQTDNSYYPENGLEYIPNLTGNNIKNISFDSIITDTGNIITSSDYIYNKENQSIQLPVETLKKFAGQTFLIKYKTDLDYKNNNLIISDYFNREEHIFDIPFEVNIKTKFANIFENNMETTAKINYPLDITVKPKKLEVKAGKLSGDYSIEDYLDMSTLALSYPNQTIKLKTDFDHNIKFDKIGSAVIPITITCEELNLKKIINVEVTVTSEPISYSDKVVLTHKIVDNQIQYSIVQKLPKQYNPVFLPKSLDYEVVVPHSEYLSFMNFTQPSLTVNGNPVSQTLYTYNKSTQKLSLSKELLTAYEDQELNIIFKSQIDKENKKVLNFIKKTSSTKSLDLDTSIAVKVTSVESPILDGDSTLYENDITLSYPLKFTITSKNLAVLVGQKVGDYLLEDYVNKTTATTGLNILDSLLSVSLLTNSDTIITQDLKHIKVLMTVDLENGWTIKQEISIPIEPILKQSYEVSMGEQFNKADTRNAHFYSYLSIPSQVNDIALPEQIIIKLEVTKEQSNIIKPKIQKIDGIPVGSYTLSTDKKQLTINKANLKKYSGETVVISWETDMNYSVPEAITYFYDKINQSFNFSNVNTIAIASHLMTGDDIFRSKTSKTYDIAYDFKFKAEALSPSYPSGTYTADNLDINLFVKNIDVDYSKSGFKRDFIASFPKEPILFEKVGSTVMVPITITSETLGLTKVIEVPVLVTEELKLGFESVPETLDIVSLTTENGENESNKSLYHLNSKEELIVKDTRKTKFWRLSMIPSELKGVSTDSKTKGKTLAGEFVERKNNKTISLIPLEEYLLIKSDKETETISELWNKATKENGMFYENNTSSNYAGQYNGTITWQLSDVPE